jgi:hypothetical protein
MLYFASSVGIKALEGMTNRDNANLLFWYVSGGKSPSEEWNDLQEILQEQSQV